MGVVGWMRDIQLSFLYMQDLAAKNSINIKKVGIKLNAVDILTKVVPTTVLHYHSPNVGLKTHYSDPGHDGVRSLTMRPMTSRSMARTNLDQRCDIHHAVHGYYTLLDYTHGKHITKSKGLHTKCKFICGVFVRDRELSSHALPSARVNAQLL